METVLLFLALALVGAVAFLLVGSRRGVATGNGHDGGAVGTGRGAAAGYGASAGSGPAGGRRAEIVGLAEPIASLPPVLLPEHPVPADIERLRLAVGLRGYRCDQVDEVLDVLAAEIGRLTQELDARSSEVENARHGPVISTTNHSPE